MDAGDSVASFHITNIPNAGTQGTLYSDVGLTTVVTDGADVAATGNAATLYFVPNANFNTHAGAVTFNAAATDNHGLTDATPATETINVTAVNDAPINNGVPASFTVQSGFNHVITGLSISDVDANEVGTPTDITTTFTAGAGTVVIGNGTSGGTAGISGGATITTNGTGTVVLTGSVAQINTTLSGNNVAYNAADSAGNTGGTTTLQMATNDHGHNGGGGAIIDTDTISVGVIPQVWFINQDQSTLDSTAVRGSQANPFSTVDEFNASSGPGTNDYIYVKAGTYSGEGINLKAGQTLLGDDQALSFANPLGGPAIADRRRHRRAADHQRHGRARDRPGHRAGLRQHRRRHHRHHQRVGPGRHRRQRRLGRHAEHLRHRRHRRRPGHQPDPWRHRRQRCARHRQFDRRHHRHRARRRAGHQLLRHRGTLSGHTTSEISINGGSGTVSYGGTIGDGTGLSASIVNRTGGTVTLSGNINDGDDTGGGIGISGNTNTTINFTGATKTLNTSIGDGVSMTNNTGRRTSTSPMAGLTSTPPTAPASAPACPAPTASPAPATRISTTGTGTALNLANVTVGAGGVTFDSVTHHQRRQRHRDRHRQRRRHQRQRRLDRRRELARRRHQRGPEQHHDRGVDYLDRGRATRSR